MQGRASAYDVEVLEIELGAWGASIDGEVDSYLST